MPNSLFQHLMDEVVVYTNRPDLVPETISAIKKATYKAHTIDEFPEDLHTVQVVPTVSPDASALTIDITAAPFVRCRKVTSISNYPVTVNYQPVGADDLFEGYGSLKSNIFYKAGLQYVLLAAPQPAQVSVNYLRFPNQDPETYDSWIAQYHESAIVEEAASMVFKAMGKDTEFQRFAQMSAQNYQLLRASHIIGY